jgi:hypothetical protein
MGESRHPVKFYKTQRGAKIAAGMKGGRVVRRNAKGQFSKRGRHWSVILPKRKTGERLPPATSTEWQIKVSYSGRSNARKGGHHPLMLDAVMLSPSRISKSEVSARLSNLANGIPLPKGFEIRAIEWKHSEKPDARTIKGKASDLGAFGNLINDPANLEIKRQK